MNQTLRRIFRISIAFTFLVLITSTVAFAQADATPPLRPQNGLMQVLPMVLVVVTVFYVMVLRPQARKLRTQQELVTNLKKGDAVTTTGGIIGKVSSVEADHVLLEVSRDVRLKIEKSHIAKTEERGAAVKAGA